MSSTASVGSLEKRDAHRATVQLQPVAEEKLHEVEIGYDIYQETKDSLEWDKKEEKRVLRKIDRWILPAFCLTQGLAFLDKTALNYGNLFGMKADLHVTGSQFSWFASAFYIGYLVAEEPANVLLQRYPTGRVMGIVCFLWGIVVMSTAACRSFGGALVNRIILGALEACVTPGLGLMTPFWWRLQEQPVRHLTWYCFNGVAGIVGDFLAYGLGHVNNVSVPSWALIFLVLGGYTTLWGLYLFFFLPDTPVAARFLDPRQKAIAVKRVAENRTGIKNKQFKVYQVKEAFTDPKTYLLFVASIAAQIPNGVVSNFSSIIISGMGFTKFQTTLLDIPSSVLQIVSLIGSGYIASVVKNSRAVMMFIGNCTCIIAAACLTYGPSDERWGRLVAFWFTSFQSVGFSLSLVMVSANVGGYTKRQVVTALTFINIAGPHVLIDSEEDIGYPTATKAMMAGYVVKTGCHVLLGLYMWNSNRLRNNAAVKDGSALSEEERARRAEEAGMTDITEFENQWFRYVL
ncbi:major facilitator superfamily domain-containing protein [Schizophyllum commune]